MPTSAADAIQRVVTPALVTAVWVATLLYAVAQGLLGFTEQPLSAAPKRLMRYYVQRNTNCA